jgi:hypothetical protein
VKRNDPKHPKNKTYVLVVKARTFEAKTKAKDRTLEAKTKAKDMNFCPRGSSRPRPVLEDYNTVKLASRDHTYSASDILLQFEVLC